MGDNVTKVFYLPFEFSYFGVNFSTISVCSNGFILFGENYESSHISYAMEADEYPWNMISFFWMDLIASTISYGEVNGVSLSNA
jgi:hypothetical protein